MLSDKTEHRDGDQMAGVTDAEQVERVANHHCAGRSIANSTGNARTLILSRFAAARGKECRVRVTRIRLGFRRSVSVREHEGGRNEDTKRERKRRM